MSKGRRQSGRRQQAPKPKKDYRTERYIQYIFSAELGVLQAATLLPKLTDGETLAALRKLVAGIRSGGLPRFQGQPTDTSGLIAWQIVQGWEDLFRQRGQLSNRDMVGCLNVVIESAETRMRTPGGRSYLKYLKKFMKRAGLSIAVEPTPDFVAVEEFYDPDQMPLAELGDLWLKEPDLLGADDAFENRAQALIVQGKAEEAMALGHRLLKRTDDPYVRAVLCTVLGAAYRHTGDLEQAVTMFQAAQSPELTYEEALDKLGEVYREMGRYEEAIQAWQKCLVHPHSAPHIHRQIATTYRQMGDLASEEAALHGLIAASKRGGGCLLLGRRKRDSIAALAQLADCLRRQGKAEWQPLARRIRRARPNHRADQFQDWAYWVREWMLVDEQDTPLGYLKLFDGRESGPMHWIPVLRAALYDHKGCPRDADPFWRGVQREIAGKPYDWVLREAQDILGELLPPSSYLFDLLEKAQQS
jgi:tetratricopeptide (TPR) repeat protein